MQLPFGLFQITLTYLNGKKLTYNPDGTLFLVRYFFFKNDFFYLILDHGIQNIYTKIYYSKFVISNIRF